MTWVNETHVAAVQHIYRQNNNKSFKGSLGLMRKFEKLVKKWESAPFTFKNLKMIQSSIKVKDFQKLKLEKNT